MFSHSGSSLSYRVILTFFCCRASNNTVPAPASNPVTVGYDFSEYTKAFIEEKWHGQIFDMLTLIDSV